MYVFSLGVPCPDAKRFAIALVSVFYEFLVILIAFSLASINITRKHIPDNNISLKQKIKHIFSSIFYNPSITYLVCTIAIKWQ